MQSLKINSSSPYFTGILAILLGLVMAIWPGDSVKFTVKILGWFLVLMGGVPIIISLMKKIPISFFSVATFILGIIILCFQHFFISIFMWIFGIMLILGAIQQFNIMTIAKKSGANIGFINMIYPAILLLAGVLVLINPFSTMEAVMIFFGVSIIFYGITIIINQIRFQKMIERIKKEESKFDITDKQ